MATIAATIPRLLAQTPPSLRSSNRLSPLAASLRPSSISGTRRRLVRTAPPPIIAHRLLRVLSAAAATQDDSTTNTNNTGVSESVSEEEIKGEEVEKEVELSPVAAELKEMLRAKKEKDEKEGVGLFNGVAEEMAEIEWPAPGKVVGTTGVVLGVIAGSTAALLSVNALLAELSDRVFAGRGIQDFLSG